MASLFLNFCSVFFIYSSIDIELKILMPRLGYSFLSSEGHSVQVG